MKTINILFLILIVVAQAATARIAPTNIQWDVQRADVIAIANLLNISGQLGSQTYSFEILKFVKGNCNKYLKTSDGCSDNSAAIQFEKGKYLVFINTRIFPLKAEIVHCGTAIFQIISINGKEYIQENDLITFPSAVFKTLLLSTIENENTIKYLELDLAIKSITDLLSSSNNKD